MKKLIFIIALVILGIFRGYAQQACIRFGIETNQFTVQSGFSTSSELKVFIQDEKGRRLSLGMIYDSKHQIIGGVGLSYIKMLRNKKKAENTVLEPYVVYNLFYRITSIHETKTSEDYNVAEGKYKSMEHYLGFGLRTNITKRLYITNEAGYGLYLGSIMKPSKPDRITSESSGTNGIGAIIKVGIGYFF